MIFHLGARRNEEQAHSSRAARLSHGGGIDPEFQPVRLAERKGAVIGEEVDVEIILADRRQRQPLVAPRQVDLAEIGRAR